MPLLTDFLWNLGPWNWFIIAVALFVLETIVPGVHFLWFGLAAVITGILGIVLGYPWQVQLIGFAVTSVLMVFLVRRFSEPKSGDTDEPGLNVRGAQYVGRVFTVAEAISAGRGKIQVGDTMWPAQGPDVPAGSRVKVTGVNGTVLIVSAAD